MGVFMATYKTTWFFEGFQQAGDVGASANMGWTETWYQTQTSMDNALAAATARGPNTYLGRRLGCLPSEYSIPWVRISDTDNPRNSKIARITGNYNGLLINQRDFPAQVTCAILVAFTVLPGHGDPRSHTRRFLLRGLPKSVINQNVIETATPAWNAIVSFLNYLGKGQFPVAPAAVGSPWLIGCEAPDVNYRPIDNLVFENPPTPFVKLTTGAGPFAAGAKLIVRGVSTPLGMNRTWTVKDASLAPQYLLGTAKQPMSGTWSRDGKVRLKALTYFPADQYLIVGLRSRRVGRPSHLFRGRRRAG
jgi:hypothetical protein